MRSSSGERTLAFAPEPLRVACVPVADGFRWRVAVVARYGPFVRTPWFLMGWMVCAGCSGPSTPDSGDTDATMDVLDASDSLELLDASSETADAAADVPFDVQPASLPGRWRLVRFSSVSAGGSTLDLTDVDQNVNFGGVPTYARVNGTLSLEPTRMVSTVGVAVGGHVFIAPGVGTADAMGVYGNTVGGMLGPMSFEPTSGSPIAFRTLADGTITMNASLPMFGNVVLGWQRIDAFPAVSGLATQAQIVRLAPTTAAPLAHPRAALAWDRPGQGTGFVMASDAALTFIGNSPTAAFNVSVTYVLPEYTATIGATTLSIAHLVVYDDANDNGRFDEGTGTTSGDGGTTVDGDPVRGVSRVVITVRSVANPSAEFLASAFRDVPPGVQLGAVRDDATVTQGRSVAPFDPTLRFALDGVIEATGTAIPDLL